MRAWLVLAMMCALGCAESRLPPGSGMDVCFQLRALEDWDEPELAVCSEERDALADGTVDDAYDYEYDGLDRLVAWGRRGEPLSEEIEYHDRLHTKTTVLYLEDGSVQSRTFERRDEHGNLLEQVSSLGLIEDGRVSVTRYDYGCWGDEPALWPGPCSFSTDDDDDGDADFITALEWDEQGRETLRVEHNFDQDVSLSVSIEYAGDGSWSRWMYDELGDGTIDLVVGIDYDGDGRTLRRWTDGDADGREERVEEFVYDEQGRTLLERRVSLGRLESLREWEYEEGGRLAIETTHPTPPLERGTTRHIRFDRAGNVVADATDYDDDDVADQCAYYSYACHFE